jgi:GAF domain-containing protein
MRRPPTRPRDGSKAPPFPCLGNGGELPYSSRRTGVLALLVSAAVALSVAVITLASWATLVRRSRVRSERRLEAVARQLDELMRAISDRIGRALERLAGVREQSGAGFGLSLNLAEVLQGLATEAAVRTDAQAAAVRISGPEDATVVASHGGGSVSPLLETTLRPPDRRPFRALTVNWTFPAALDGEPESFRSALVVPIVEDGHETGGLAAYARAPAAFRPEHARTLEALVTEASVAIGSARRFAVLERLALGRREETSEHDEPPGAGGDDPARSGSATISRTAD